MRLRDMSVDTHLSPQIRTAIVEHWGNALARRGNPQRAGGLLAAWMRRTDPAHLSAGFYERMHHIHLLQLGNWDGATRILEEANRRAPWKRPSEQRAHQALADTHYEHMFFTDYELRRRAAATAREHIAPKD